MYDGTLESLENKSHRPHTPHPNAQTAEEIKHIQVYANGGKSYQSSDYRA